MKIIKTVLVTAFVIVIFLTVASLIWAIATGAADTNLLN